MKVLRTALLQIALLTSFATLTDAQSPTSQRSRPVAVGEVAPDFTLEDQNGNKVALSDARTRSPVVIVFYRGYW